METYQNEATAAAREIAQVADQMAAATSAEELTPATLERLAAHAESLGRALSEFRQACIQAAKEAL